MMAKRIERTATTTLTYGERERERRWRNKIILNRCGSMRVEKLDGLAVRAIPAMGPLCERSKACSCSTMRSINRQRNWRSTRDAASCCQPRLAPGSNSSASCVGGRKPFARASHVGGSKPSTPVNSLADLDACMQRRTRIDPIQLTHHF